MGIIAMLDEECIVPKATDLTLAQKLNEQVGFLLQILTHEIPASRKTSELREAKATER
jgi:hypothetical protein